jgi:cytochrome c peroxidase
MGWSGGWAVALLAPAALAAVVPSEPGAAAERLLPEDHLAELGRRPFFDTTLGPTGSGGCVTCHVPALGYSDRVPRSADASGPTTRASQPLVDSGDWTRFHSDGEFESVESLATARLGSTEEVRTNSWGKPVKEPTPSVAEVADRAGLYDHAFEAAFGSPKATTPRMARALGAFVRTIRSGPSPYDRFESGDESALTESARRGLELFRGRAGCAECHRIEGPRAPFTDFRFHNTGISWAAVKRGTIGEPEVERIRQMRQAAVARVVDRRFKAATEPDFTAILEESRRYTMDAGRAFVSRSKGDFARFKIPTLRDAARRAVFMHDGSMSSLDDVVRY